MTIKELSRIFNISDQMIRYYEKQGLLHPMRSNNGYRHYSAKDAYDLLTLLKYNQLGVSSRLILDALDSPSPDKLKTAIDNIYNQLSISIQKDLIFQEYIQTLSKELQTAVYNEGLTWYEHRPSVRYIDYSPVYACSSADFKCEDASFSRWINHLAICDPECLFDVNNLKNSPESCGRWSLVCWDKMASVVDKSLFSNCAFYPEQIAIVSIVKTPLDDLTLREKAKEFLHLAETKGIKPHDIIAAKIISRFTENSKSIFLCKLILPIQQFECFDS